MWRKPAEGEIFKTPQVPLGIKRIEQARTDPVFVLACRLEFYTGVGRTLARGGHAGATRYAEEPRTDKALTLC